MTIRTFPALLLAALILACLASCDVNEPGPMTNTSSSTWDVHLAWAGDTIDGTLVLEITTRYGWLRSQTQRSATVHVTYADQTRVLQGGNEGSEYKLTADCVADRCAYEMHITSLNDTISGWFLTPGPKYYNLYGTRH
jgi:hypothetical protein